MRQYVLGFMFNSDGSRVVLIRKDHPEWQAGKLNGVGGKIIPKEKPLDAMVREFREEAGASFYLWQRFAKMTGTDFSCFCYRAFDDEAFDAAETMEAEEIVKLDVDEVLDMRRVPPVEMIPNLRWLIPLALDRDGGPSGVSVDYS